MRYSVDAEMMNSAIFVVSHPRSGTHLMIDTLRKNFSGLRGWKLPLFPASNLFLNENQLRGAMKEPGTTRFWGIRKKYPIIKSHKIAQHPDWQKYRDNYGLADFKGKVIYVYRNPLRVMLSYYSYEMNKGMIPRTFKAFIKEYDGHPLKQWRRHVDGYCSREDVCAIEYDILLNDPESCLIKIDKYLSLPLTRSATAASLLPAKPEYSQLQLLKARLCLQPESTATMAPKLSVEQQEIDWARGYINEVIGDFLGSLGVEL